MKFAVTTKTIEYPVAVSVQNFPHGTWNQIADKIMEIMGIDSMTDMECYALCTLENGDSEKIEIAYDFTYGKVIAYNYGAGISTHDVDSICQFEEIEAHRSYSPFIIEF